jgi:predicted exporter
VRLTLFAIITLALSAYVYTSLDVRTAITEFLPRDEKAQRLELARELSQSTQSRAVVITLGADDESEHIAAARALAESLRKSGEFAWVRAGLETHEQQLFYALYFPARVGLLDLPPGEGPVPDAWLKERVEALKTRLTSPLGMLERRFASEDPLGAFMHVLDAFGRERGSLTLHDGQLVTSDGKHSVLFAETKQAAFDSAAQHVVAADITAAFSALQKQHPKLTLAWSGVNRFALATEASVKGDIERISSLSLVGIFFLYLLIFRSLREPIVVLLPIAFGCLASVAACQAVFGFVHGLSLAFGSSIIGVAEDFSTHFFAHRRATPEAESNEALMRRLWPGMWLGAVTTVVGISALTASGFPGLVQMALFGGVGVLGALLCTRYVLPALSRTKPLPPTRHLGPWGVGIVRGLRRHPARALWLIVPALLCTAIGGAQLQLEGGMRALRTPTPELDRENQYVQSLLGRQSVGRAVIAQGKDDQEALARAEQASQLLAQARARGELADFRSVTGLVPSRATQLRTRARLAGDPTFVSRLHSALEAGGFAPGAFSAFDSELARPDPILLTPEQVLASPLADVVRPFRVELAHGVAYLIPINSAQVGNLDGLFAGKPGMFYIDQEALFDDAFARFRSRAIWLLAVGLVLVVVTLLARYRSLRVAALGMLPALLGAGATLGIEGLFGVHVTLMHVIAILLVVSMGVDYGIYVLESRHSLEEGVTTLGSILLAALTTVLSFGLLGLSDNPALAGIGTTVALGLVLTVFASPVVLALVRDEHNPEAT